MYWRKTRIQARKWRAYALFFKVVMSRVREWEMERSRRFLCFL